MTTLEAIDIVKKHSIEFVFWEGKIQKSLTDKTVVGINGRASSLLRLPFTIKRLRYIIDENKMREYFQEYFTDFHARGDNQDDISSFELLLDNFFEDAVESAEDWIQSEEDRNE